MILVTGGTGYIGSFLVRRLISSKKNICVIDNLSNSFRNAISKAVLFYPIDLLDAEALENVFQAYSIKKVVHLAAKASVEESVKHPEIYFENNVNGLKNLLNCCKQFTVEQFLFASSGTVYGNTKTDGVINETDSTNPINPYGESKLKGEELLKDYSRTQDNMRISVLRFFNVVGACQESQLGQRSKSKTHLLNLACEASFSKDKSISIFGTDYPTKDGTAVRDYIHVEDLVDIMMRIIEANTNTKSENQIQIFNCGYGKGYSVKEVLECFQQINQIELKLQERPRRPGDPAYLVGNCAKIQNHLNWEPKFNSLDIMCQTAYLWEEQQKLKILIS